VEGVLDWSGTEHGKVAGSCKHSNEPSGSIKAEIYLLPKQLSASQEGICSISFLITTNHFQAMCISTRSEYNQSTSTHKIIYVLLQSFLTQILYITCTKHWIVWLLITFKQKYLFLLNILQALFLPACMLGITYVYMNYFTHTQAGFYSLLHACLEQHMSIPSTQSVPFNTQP
jgi:hypothetical protein